MKPWLELLKLRITVASTVTTFVGYVMARGRVDLPLLAVLAGIMLQACGAAALNQVQDASPTRAAFNGSGQCRGNGIAIACWKGVDRCSHFTQFLRHVVAFRY